MVTQLDERPSRVERRSFADKMNDVRSYRAIKDNVVPNPTKILGNVTKKPITLNFICMCMVAGVLDIIGLFTSEIPGVGIVISITSATIFVPWFYFSGIKFNMKKIGTFGSTSILEMIPIIGNLPLILVNVIYSYYSE
jgi:hypothetical protein